MCVRRGEYGKGVVRRDDIVTSRYLFFSLTSIIISSCTFPISFTLKKNESIFFPIKFYISLILLGFLLPDFLIRMRVS